MASLEELLYSSLIADSTLLAKLAQFRSKPAVFEKQAPIDTNPGWGAAKYPRLEYYSNYQDDPQRKVSGSLGVDIVSKADAVDGAEVIESAVRNCLDGLFLETDRGTTSLRWLRSEIFDTIDKLYLGQTSMFDLLAFPKQTTTSPDPIAGLMAWTKTLLGATGAYYIEGTAQTGLNTWKPTAQKPAIYWRIVNITLVQTTNTVVWFNMTCACHVITPLPADRIGYIKQICEGLAKAGEVSLADGSPFTLINSISADSNSDPISQGQIAVTGRYGVLRDTVTSETLENVYIDGVNFNF